MGKTTLEEVLALSKQLSLMDKIRLIERIAPQIERELKSAQGSPRSSLRGLWSGLNITEEDIDEARHDLWDAFPRQDV
jgi:hypothetical protein